MSLLDDLGTFFSPPNADYQPLASPGRLTPEAKKALEEQERIKLAASQEQAPPSLIDSLKEFINPSKASNATQEQILTEQMRRDGRMPDGSIDQESVLNKRMQATAYKTKLNDNRYINDLLASADKPPQPTLLDELVRFNTGGEIPSNLAAEQLPTPDNRNDPNALTNSATPTRPLSPQEQRVASLNTTFQTDPFYANDNIVAKVQPNGNIEFSGTSKAKVNPNALPSTDSEKFTVSSIQKRVADISNIKDSNEVVTQFNEFRGQMAGLQAELTDKAFSTATNTLGIPMLETQLTKLQAYDKLQPGFAIRPVYSPATLAAQSLLDKARGQVDNEAKNILARNPEYNAMIAQSKNADIILQRHLTKLGAADQFKVQKDYVNEAKEEDILQQTRPETIQRARTLFGYEPAVVQNDGSMRGMSDKDVALAIARTKNLSAEDKQALEAPPDKLVDFSLLGNPSATRALIAEEARRTSTDPDLIKRSVEGMTKLLKDPTLLTKIAEIEARATGGKPKEIASRYMLQDNQGTKAEKDSLKLKKIEYVKQVTQQVFQSKFENDLRSWGPVADVDLQSTINSLGDTASLDRVLRAFVGTDAVNSPEYMRKIDVVSAQLANSGKRYGNSVIASIDIPTLRMTLPSRALPPEVKKVLFGDLGFNFGGTTNNNPIEPWANQ